MLYPFSMEKNKHFSYRGIVNKAHYDSHAGPLPNRRAYLKQNVRRKPVHAVSPDHSLPLASEALSEERSSYQASNRPQLADPLVISPFKRKVANSNISEYKARDHADGMNFKAVLSPLKIPCPYCSGLIRINATGCSHCLRGLQNYWLWENAVCKRLLLLFSLVMLPILLVAAIVIL